MLVEAQESNRYVDPLLHGPGHAVVADHLNDDRLSVWLERGDPVRSVGKKLHRTLK